MSQSSTVPATPSASTGRIALAIGVVALVIGASALGYAVYLGMSQVPSQISAVSVNQPCSTAAPCANKTIRIEWETALNSGQDRFFPEFITIVQGDNLTITLITNDTSDAHTFTLGLGMRGLPSSAVFQLNNSWTGLSSGPYITPRDGNFTGKATGCSDNNGNPTTCNTQKAGSGDCNNTAASPPACNLSSVGYLGVVNTPGVYQFFCFYHRKAGMLGYITVLPNRGFTP